MPIESPCIGLCQMDKSRAACKGCHRTLEEITRWSQASEPEKQRILDAVAQRKAGSGKPSLPARA